MTEAAAPTAKPGKSKPTARELASKRICPNCGKPSPSRTSARGPAPLYCRPNPETGQNCKKEMGNRNLRDGLSLVPFVKAWRATRGSGPVGAAAFARVCETADMLNEEDRTAKRPRADYLAAVMLETQVHSVADQRYGRRKVEESRRRAGEVEEEKQTKPFQRDRLTDLRAKLDDPATTDNERAILQAALEIMGAA